MEALFGTLLVLSYPLTGTLVLGGCGACGRASWRVVLVVAALWCLPAIAWLAFSPISVCSLRLVRSYPYDRGDGGAWETYWCSRPCTADRVVRAASVDDVRRALASATTLRVVGAGHSTTDLQCASDGSGSESESGSTVVLSVDGLCSYRMVSEDVLAVGAGCTVYDTQAWLVAHVSRQLRGFGSITVQRIGGAVSTSLHGQHVQPFVNHVVGVRAVLANGTETDVTGDDVGAWLGAMGQLGVIVEVRLRTVPIEYVECTSERRATMLASLKDPTVVGFEAKAVVRRSDGRVGDYLVRTCRPAARGGADAPSSLARTDDLWSGFVADNVALDAALFLGALVPAMPGTTDVFQGAVHTAESRDGVVATVDDYRAAVSYNPHFDEEYAVPVEVCEAAVVAVADAVRRHASLDVHVYVRRVDASAGWLTWAPVDSCAIRLEFFRFSGDGVRVETAVREAVEDAVVALHGTGHFGKPWYTAPHRLLSVSPHKARFAAYRAALDPHGVLQNAFTRALWDEDGTTRRPAAWPPVLPPALDARLFVWRFLVSVGIVASAAMWVLACCSRCCSRCRSRCRSQKEEEAAPTPVVVVGAARRQEEQRAAAARRR
jgi:FAD/FMN-containing dehydrogenase